MGCNQSRKSACERVQQAPALYGSALFAALLDAEPDEADRARASRASEPNVGDCPYCADAYPVRYCPLSLEEGAWPLHTRFFWLSRLL
jgi:hypothetical protein